MIQIFRVKATRKGDSKVVNQHTELEHTPKRNLYQQAISAGIPFIIGVAGGIAGLGVCQLSGCVARNFLGGIDERESG